MNTPKIRIASRSLMCSSLIIGGFGYGNHPTLRTFKLRLRQAVQAAEDEDNNDKIYSPYDDQGYELIHVLAGCRVEDFAFIMATTDLTGNEGDDEIQPGIEKRLKEVGFKKIFDKTTHNEKNETDINIWVMRVVDFLEAIKE